MRTPLAILNLLHQGPKALVSVGGVAFALLLVFMQLGFMGAVSHTATNLLEHLRFDAIIRAPDYTHMYEAGVVELHWLEAAANVPGVRSASPFWITVHNWRKLPTALELEEGSYQPRFQPIAIIGVDASRQIPLELDEVIEQQETLRLANTMLVDVSTHAEYGPWNGRRFSQADLEQRRTTEVGAKEYRIAGLFRLGTGLAANGLVVMGRAAFDRMWPLPTDHNCSLGLLVFEQDVQHSPEQIVARIRDKLTMPSSASSQAGGRHDAPVDVLSREEMIAAERYRWLWQTPIGLIFQLGAGLSLVVGAAIVYMVLATDVANRLPEYATLLAIGYSRGYLCGVVLTQALALAAAGFFASWLVAEGMYRVVASVSGIPLEMELQRIISVAGLGVLMCTFSGMLALRKLWKAEPASLF